MFLLSHYFCTKYQQYKYDTFLGDFKHCRAFYTKKVIDDFNDLFSRFSTHAWKNLVRLFLPFGSGSGGRGSGASVRVFFSGIARVISAHDRTRGHYYAKAVSKKKQHMLLYYDEDLEL